jgi:ketosteroid isomerase-like protein
MNNTELCRALFEAFQDGNEALARSLCSPDLVAIQNGNPPMNLDMLLQFSRAVLNVVTDFRYEDARRSATDTGFVEEHSVRAELPDGSTLDLAACVVGEVRDGKICELREYFDGTAAAGLVAALS